MVGWMRWHCHPHNKIEIRALAVRCRERYLLVLHNIDLLGLRVSGEDTFCFFETWRLECMASRISQAGSFKHCIKAPALGVRGVKNFNEASILRHHKLISPWRDSSLNHNIAVITCCESVIIISVTVGWTTHPYKLSPHCPLTTCIHITLSYWKPNITWPVHDTRILRPHTEGPKLHPSFEMQKHTNSSNEISEIDGTQLFCWYKLVILVTRRTLLGAWRIHRFP